MPQTSAKAKANAMQQVVAIRGKRDYVCRKGEQLDRDATGSQTEARCADNDYEQTVD